MINKIISLIFSVIFTLSGITIDYSEEVNSGEYIGLKDIYSNYFDIGCSMGSYHILIPEYIEFMLKNYSSFTPEVELKLPFIHPSKNVWNFDQMDSIAKFCKENKIKLRGHCLLWGSDDNWMLYDDNGNYVDKETYYARQYDYFKEIMDRYGDVITVWDVVNEPFNYNNKCAFKQTPIYEICGEEYITKAFEQAREIAPNATLVLNETGLLNSNKKQKYFFEYMEKWLSEGMPIDAVGIQGHWQLFSFSETPIRLKRLLKKICKLDIKEIQITEMDLTLYPNFVKKDYKEIPQWMRDFQNMRYQQYFEIFRDYSNIITSVTFWGMDDSLSCLRQGHPNNEVFLFDENRKPKDAYFGVTDF